jgi:hypothetical protein
MHTNTGRQTRQKLREPLQRAQRPYLFYFSIEQEKNNQMAVPTLVNPKEKEPLLVLGTYRKTPPPVRPAIPVRVLAKAKKYI